MAGYSGTPLVKKLGIKEDCNAVFVYAPKGFERELELPAGVTIKANPKQPIDFVLLFVKKKQELEKAFLRYALRLKPTGMLWVSWPKKSSGVSTDLTENVVRDVGLAKGMVDVKVCAVDEVWSGLKFVFRLKDRPKK